MALYFTYNGEQPNEPFRYFTLAIRALPRHFILSLCAESAAFQHSPIIVNKKHYLNMAKKLIIASVVFLPLALSRKLVS